MCATTMKTTREKKERKEERRECARTIWGEGIYRERKQRGGGPTAPRVSINLNACDFLII